MNRPLTIGLTGSVGAGKSTVAEILHALGADIVSGDALGRQVVEGSPAILQTLRARFGDEIFASDGSLLRRALGERVFASAELTHWLTGLTFPGIHALWLQAVRQTTARAIVLDAALIFEWGIEQDFDFLVLIAADRQQVADRLSRSRRLTPAEAESRLGVQIPPSVKRNQAHIVFENNHSLAALQSAVENWWQAEVLPAMERSRRI
jgi:dephospho-CoA kinase